MRNYFAQQAASDARGTTLSESLVALAFVMLGGVFAFNLIQNGRILGKKVEFVNDRSSLAKYLSNATDCTTTLQALSGVPAGTIIKLLGRDTAGSTITLADNVAPGKKYFEFTVRAEASAAGSVIVRVARLRPSGTLTSSRTSDFIPEPVNNKVITWSSPDSLLFGNRLELCQGYGTNRTQVNCQSGGAFCDVTDFSGYYQMKTGNLALASGSTYAGTVNCPFGMRAVNGGISCDNLPGGGTGNGNPVANYTGWHAACTASGSPTGTLAHQMFVICIKMKT